jgi:hypothetical protein
MRRKPDSPSLARILPDDRWNPSVDGSRLHGDLQHGPSGATPHHPEVVNNFPEVVPVTQSELDVIETYLGSLLDDMLNHTH